MKRNVISNRWIPSAMTAFLAASAFSPAEVLTQVPMQGGMVMPMIAYDANAGRLQVTLTGTIPQLTPLLVSHPGDTFDPGDPWFDDLDPSCRGLAFSRRYGFVMDALTDPLPAGRVISIRKLSRSPELGFFRYRSSEPKAWEAIFGTASSSNAMVWNGMMFHPGVTAPSGSNVYTATFEAYLLDLNSGAELPNTGTGPFVLDWTCIPDGRPDLAIGRRTVICWCDTVTGYELEGTDDLTSGIWTPVTNAPVTIAGEAAVVLNLEETRRFFRMKRIE